MTVRELIDALNKEPNKDKPVTIYVPFFCNKDDLLVIMDLDYSISDRLDINCCSSYGRSI